PDNNGSERGIRNIKVKQKVSGQFVSIQKAIDFVVVRSVFDTIIKNGGNIFQIAKNIAQLSLPE
ncbi:MAG: transposase, partial [Arcticibacterium sp.]